MLVLSRKVGEQVVVGNQIYVTVVDVRGGKVRLGFTAPDDMPVHREEVARRIAFEEANPTEIAPESGRLVSECA